MENGESQPQQPQTTPTQKVYCCSNFPQTEATIIAKVDLVFHIIIILICIIIIAIVSSDGSPPDIINQNAQLSRNETVTNDINHFFQWPKSHQITLLSLDIASSVVKLGFTILLLVGVKRKNHAYLLTWFIFNIVYLIWDIISSVVIIVLAGDKVLISVVSVFAVLYKWYCLWILKLLMSEIRAVREGYTNPLDDGETDQANNHLMPSSDSFTVDKF